MMPSSSQGRLPTGFREVEWLQGSGTQYCETDVNPIYSSSNFTSIKGDIIMLDRQNSAFEIGSHWYQLWSGVQSEFEYSFDVAYVHQLPQDTYKTVSRFRYGRSSANLTTIDLPINVFPLDIHYEINQNNLILNGASHTKYDNHIQYATTKPILIGADSVGNTVSIRNTLTRVKSFYVYNNDTLLYEFVPCYRKSDNKTGFMKITVADGSTTFFPNLGTDEWIIGPVV